MLSNREIERDIKNSTRFTVLINQLPVGTAWFVGDLPAVTALNQALDELDIPDHAQATDDGAEVITLIGLHVELVGRRFIKDEVNDERQVLTDALFMGYPRPMVSVH